jgi:PAS domain S-box-containing protein
MGEAFPSIAPPRRSGETMPEAAAAPRDGGLHYHDEMRWALDISRVRPIIDSVARGEASPDWMHAILSGTHAAEVAEDVENLIHWPATREHVLGQPLSAFWPPGSRDVLAQLIVAVASDNAASNTRVRRIAPEGRLQDPVLTIWRSVEPHRGDLVFLTITDAPKSERAGYSRGSEARYLDLIHHAQTAMLQVDASCMSPIYDKLQSEGISELGLNQYLNDHPELVELADGEVRVVQANLSAARLLGCATPAEVIGPVAFMFTVSHDSQQRIIVARFAGKRHYSEVVKLVTFDGRVRDVRLSITFPAPRENVDVHLATLEDVTDRLRTEAQLRQLQTDLTHAARISTLGELATSIAHEVNQPLSAIVTNAETSLRWMAREDPNLAKVTQLTTRIAQSARHASDIVRRIRAMTTRHPPERVPLDLNDVVDETLLFLGYEIASRSIDLSVLHAREIPRVLGDRVQLQQVFVNLVLNALQAMTPDSGRKGRIFLETGMDGEGRVVFSIRDNGPGIPNENLDLIFDSFFTTKDDGMGIGLAICQSIIAAHGGTLTASNDPGGGAIFQVTLPAMAPG